jgi:hypothetical protein
LTSIERVKMFSSVFAFFFFELTQNHPKKIKKSMHLLDKV